MIVNSAVGRNRIYKALLTQSSTNAPVATVIENSLGADVVWSYDNVGNYLATCSVDDGAFPEDLVAVKFGVGINIFHGQAVWQNQNEIVITTSNAAGVAGNNLLASTYIEIEVLQ